jgi:hypothetical protein
LNGALLTPRNLLIVAAVILAVHFAMSGAKSYVGKAPSSTNPDA